MLKQEACRTPGFHKAEIECLQTVYASELDRARLDADRTRDDAKVMIEQMKDLTDKLNRQRQTEVDRLQSELEQARSPWWSQVRELY
jgi:hypothetical protein